MYTQENQEATIWGHFSNLCISRTSQQEIESLSLECDSEISSLFSVSGEWNRILSVRPPQGGPTRALVFMTHFHPFPSTRGVSQSSLLGV
ncbi:hypothetical protein CDAR_550281 [Caerostris darwini]|uniref:Uncharacterized protein n=1 Tax=Caerostris darwini TaxID=1538125 RepID=A0AAV4X8K8_9ARAC|nr:hypothetical protein CDAR_550281 [Caerostris darwini]